MFCNDCGAENPDAAKFCSNCGAAIGVVEQVVKYESEKDFLAMNGTERKARAEEFMKRNPGSLIISVFYMGGALLHFVAILFGLLNTLSIPYTRYLTLLMYMIVCAYLVLAICSGNSTAWWTGMGLSLFAGICMVVSVGSDAIFLLPFMIYMWRNRTEYGIPKEILSKLTNDYKELNELRKS